MTASHEINLNAMRGGIGQVRGRGRRGRAIQMEECRSNVNGEEKEWKKNEEELGMGGASTSALLGST